MNAWMNRFALMSLLLMLIAYPVSQRSSADGVTTFTSADTPEALAGLNFFNVFVNPGIPNSNGTPIIDMGSYSGDPLDIYARKKLTAAGVGTFHQGDGVSLTLGGGLMRIEVNTFRTTSSSVWAYQAEVKILRYMNPISDPNTRMLSTVWTMTGLGLMPRKDYRKPSTEVERLIDMAVKDIVKGNAKKQP